MKKNKAKLLISSLKDRFHCYPLSVYLGFVFPTFFRFVTSETPAIALVLQDTVLFLASLFSGHAVHVLLFLAPHVISQCLCPSWGQMSPIPRSSVRASSVEPGFVRCIDMTEPRSSVFTLSSRVSSQGKAGIFFSSLGCGSRAILSEGLPCTLALNGTATLLSPHYLTFPRSAYHHTTCYILFSYSCFHPLRKACG